MDRDRATRQIERIVQSIESPAFPAAAVELYVFGSYARGAVAPNDIDLILVHEPAPSDLLARFKAEVMAEYGRDVLQWPRSQHPEWRFETSIRQAIRKPGEKIDLLLTTSLKRLFERAVNIEEAGRVLVWSRSDRNWSAKIAAIKIDPSAGRHQRDHFANIRRFDCDLSMMVNVTEAIACGFLKLTKLDAATIEPSLNVVYQHWQDHWVRCEVMGKQSIKLLQYGMWWMQQQRGQNLRRPHPPHQCVMTSEDGHYSVYFGTPPLHAVYSLMEENGQRDRICLIPHFKHDQIDELFIFERGKRRNKKEFEAIMNRF